VIELMLSKKKLNETVGMILHQINTHSTLAVPSVLVWTHVDNPLLGSTLLFVTLITWMKLVSYMRANEDYRLSPSESTSLSLVQNLDAEDEDLAYPQNVTLSNLLYFWCAPTLTYQLAFPKYPVRRWWQVASLVTRIIFVASMVTFLTAQIIMPLLESLVGELEASGGNYTVPILAKYWLKLSLASTYTWRKSNAPLPSMIPEISLTMYSGFCLYFSSCLLPVFSPVPQLACRITTFW